MKTVEYKRHIAEILKAAKRIEETTQGLSREDFLRDRARVAAAGDDLASIGRAVGSLPEKIRTRYPAIDWDAVRRAAGAPESPMPVVVLAQPSTDEPEDVSAWLSTETFRPCELTATVGRLLARSGAEAP